MKCEIKDTAASTTPPTPPQMAHANIPIAILPEEPVAGINDCQMMIPINNPIQKTLPNRMRTNTLGHKIRDSCARIRRLFRSSKLSRTSSILKLVSDNDFREALMIFLQSLVKTVQLLCSAAKMDNLSTSSSKLLRVADLLA